VNNKEENSSEFWSGFRPRNRPQASSILFTSSFDHRRSNLTILVQNQPIQQGDWKREKEAGVTGGCPRPCGGIQQIPWQLHLPPDL
jgi:hypothetical protein